MRRALVGFGLSLVVAVCIAMLDESNGWMSGFLWVIPTSLFFISFGSFSGYIFYGFLNFSFFFSVL